MVQEMQKREGLGKKAKEKPIIFNSAMVLSLLSGSKTQTRRIIKPQPPAGINELHGGKLSQRAPYLLEHPETGQVIGHGFEDESSQFYKCPYGFIDDVLWVRETWAMPKAFDQLSPSAAKQSVKSYLSPNVAYLADESTRGANFEFQSRGKTRVSIHMPRWACRLRLRITDIRVERLQDISEADAQAEGVERTFEADGSEYGAGLTHAVDNFAKLWQSINGPDSWQQNLWVWVVGFHRLEKHE